MDVLGNVVSPPSSMQWLLDAILCRLQSFEFVSMYKVGICPTQYGHGRAQLIKSSNVRNALNHIATPPRGRILYQEFLIQERLDSSITRRSGANSPNCSALRS